MSTDNEARRIMTGRAIRALALVSLLAGAGQGARAQLPASEMGLEIAPELHRPAGLAATSRPELLVAEGEVLYDAGRYKEAAASFERALQLGMARPHEAAWKVARSYAKLGNRKQALRWAEIAELLGSSKWKDAQAVLPAMPPRGSLDRAT